MTGGKQYKVSPGQIIDVERLKAENGKTIELDRVLVLADGDKVTIGAPTVEGAKVIATSQGEFKDKKTLILKFKAKSHYDKMTGHRQILTRLLIDKIIGPGIAEASEKPKKTTTRRRTTKKEVKEDGT